MTTAVDENAVFNALLEGVEADTQAKILRITNTFPLDKSDPLFLLLLANSSVQALMEETPQQLQHTIEIACQQALDRVDNYEKAAKRGIERQIAEAAKELIQKAGASKAQITIKSLIAAGAIAFGLLGLGVLGGWGYSQWRQSQVEMAPGGPRQLTLAEAEALDWAISAEGQLARNIVTWNEDLLGGECQQQVQELGITIQIGSRQAKSGFCLLWTQPPAQREFYSAQ
ncbi:MAG: hypothetical protein F6K04_00885 [Leptolyngbya sp. SIO4C5]|nr:hypothetical protein [Leptolyngbya sp. SIO4C5]